MSYNYDTFLLLIPTFLTQHFSLNFLSYQYLIELLPCWGVAWGSQCMPLLVTGGAHPISSMPWPQFIPLTQFNIMSCCLLGGPIQPVAWGPNVVQLGNGSMCHFHHCGEGGPLSCKRPHPTGKIGCHILLVKWGRGGPHSTMTPVL